MVQMYHLPRLCLISAAILAATSTGVASTSYSVWVCMPDDGQILLIDSGDFQIKSEFNVTMGDYPWRIAFTPDGQLALVLCRDSANVVVIDAVERVEVGSIQVGEHPFAVRIDRGGAYACVTNAGSGTMSIIDIESMSLLSSVNLGSEPSGLALSADGELAYVNMKGAGVVSVIMLNDRSMLGNIEVGASPWGIDIAPDGVHCYVSCEAENRVYVLNLEENEVLKKVEVNEGPRGLVVLPSGKAVYAPGKEAVSIIETRGNSKIDASGIHGHGWEAAITPDSVYAFVTTGEVEGEQTVEVIDTSRMEKIESIWLGEGATDPKGVAIHPITSGGKLSTTISCSAAVGDEDQTVVLEGAVLPWVEGVTVILDIVRPDDSSFKLETRTGPSGEYSTSYKANATGRWKATASFPGDELHEASVSGTSEFTVGSPGIGELFDSLGQLGTLGLAGAAVVILVVAIYSALGGRE